MLIPASRPYRGQACTGTLGIAPGAGLEPARPRFKVGGGSPSATLDQELPPGADPGPAPYRGAATAACGSGAAAQNRTEPPRVRTGGRTMRGGRAGGAGVEPATARVQSPGWRPAAIHHRVRRPGIEPGHPLIKSQMQSHLARDAWSLTGGLNPAHQVGSLAHRHNACEAR